MECRRTSRCFASGKVKTVLACSIILIVIGLPKEAFCSIVNESTEVSRQWTNSSFMPVICSFSPDRIDGLVEGSEVVVTIANCSYRWNGASASHVILRSFIDDSSIVSVIDYQLSPCDLYNEDRVNVTSNCSFVVRGLFLGRTVIRIGSAFENSSKLVVKGDDSFTEYHVSVVRKERVIDHLFLGLVTLMVIFANVGMGCKIELPVVKEVLMKPIAPAIGFCCQYLIMPLTAFAVVNALGLSGGLALGYFATGCAPGGGSSNMYTYLLGGDVSLSVTMTLVSILASLGMIPLWLFTLGKLLIDPKTTINIPYKNIMVSLSCILIPIIIGLLIQRFWKRGAAVIIRFLRPVYIVFILMMFTLGVWSNLFVFKVIFPMLVLAGCLLPYAGFLLSGFVAYVLRQPLKRVLTISIETGIQNTGLAIILMKFSLPQPEADLSIASPIMVAMFMPLPLWIAVGIVEFRRRYRGRQNSDADEAAARMNNDPEETKETLPGNDIAPNVDNVKVVVSKNGTASAIDNHVNSVGGGVANGNGAVHKQEADVVQVSSF